MMKEELDKIIKKTLSEMLKEIDDISLQWIIREIIFSDLNHINWYMVLHSILAQRPETKIKLKSLICLYEKECVECVEGEK